MLVISEYKLSKEERQAFKAKGYRVAYGYEDPIIHKGESVGYLLQSLYKNTMEQIDYLLYKKHTISIKFEEKTTKLTTQEDFRRSNAYIEYQAHREAYFEELKVKKAKAKYEIITEYYPEQPEDLDQILQAFGYLYQLDIDYGDNFSKLTAYQQIKYYLEHDIEYANEPRPIDPEFEGQFESINWNGIQVVSFGDQTVMEDIINKNTDAQPDILDQLIMKEELGLL